MKLNEKGKRKILDNPYWFMNEFEPDDFEGGCFQNGNDHMVCLTVEEANLLFKVIDGFFDLRLPTTKEIVALNKLKVRVERIKQAEKRE